MDFKQGTIDEILTSEHEMVLCGHERYGEYFENALEFYKLLDEFIKSVNPDRFIFVIFLTQIKKHYILSLFSILRLHHVQAQMDARQVLEAGACAAYAIAKPDQSGFAETGEHGVLEIGKKVTGKIYKWLNGNFPDGSKAIKNVKGVINNSAAHSNIAYAHKSFKFDNKRGLFEAPFFDFEDKFLVQADLWQLGNIALLLMDLFCGINKKYNVIKFSDSFFDQLKLLGDKNQKIKEKMMKTKRFKDTQSNFSK